jgi:hypothetical protein
VGKPVFAAALMHNFQRSSEPVPPSSPFFFAFFFVCLSSVIPFSLSSPLLYFSFFPSRLPSVAPFFLSFLPPPFSLTHNSILLYYCIII